MSGTVLETRRGVVARAPTSEASALADRYQAVRAATVALCEGLTGEDCQVQSMADASPVKWHLAHTTWFFETFVLAAAEPSHTPHDARYAGLFNSYYHGVGPQHPRAERGLLSRPSLPEVLAWRAVVDQRIDGVLRRGAPPALAARLVLGLQHEQQHQELILTDVKHALFCNPLRPALRAAPAAAPPLASGSQSWIRLQPGVGMIGHDGDGFAFDNERPRHRVQMFESELAARPVSNSEFREFIDDGGYADPLLWLADGWPAVQAGGWTRPLYWSEDCAQEFTLHGTQPLDPHAPVCHLSYFEADAFARWAAARLPREEEWECVAALLPVSGQFAESGVLHPRRLADGQPGFYGSVWQWTASAYLAYPGFRPEPGALGEYNGKFMCNQFVLRGGSCASRADHLRASYRNFFAPQARWQFSGLRLARETHA